MADDVSLRDAPWQFFDARWHGFVELCGGDRETALEALGPEPGILGYYRAEAAKLGNALARRHEERAALGAALVANFLAELVSGVLVATALSPPSLERRPIPAELWRELKPDFADASAKWGDMVLKNIRIAAAAAGRAPSLAVRCVEFLRRRQAEGESRKKLLEREARLQFGDGLTTRDFNAAFKEVFARRRGRPRSGARLP